MVYNRSFLNMMVISCLMVSGYSFSGDYNNELFQGAGLAIVCSAGLYTASKVLERYQTSQLVDSPKDFQDWAKNTLREKKVTDVDLLVFKDDKKWFSYSGGGFIGVDSKDSKQLLQIISKKQVAWSDDERKQYATIEWGLLHENKHVQNYDTQKMCILGGVGISVVNGAATPSAFLLSSLLFIGSTILYKRYQEEQADFYAFMNMSQRNLHRMEDYFNQKTDRFKIAFEQDKSIFNTMTILIARIMSLFFFYRDSYGLRLASFLHDWQHPDSHRRVELVQKALWERQYETL